MADALLIADEVDFNYGSVQVLFGVSLRVDPGEMLALLGTNGAGKSTLLRVIAGLNPPSRGRVVLDGIDVSGSDAVSMVARGVVLVEGGRSVFPALSVEENLEVGAYSLRKSGRGRERRREAFDRFPKLAELRRRRAGTLSGGEQQLLAIAKAFLLEPRVLLIDELSLGLAPVVVESLLDQVRTANGDGGTVVLVEQSINVAASLCERAVFLEKGAVRFEGSTVELLDRDDIARAVFLGASRQ